ncbi:MAG: glycosyltransferase family 39 protein [Candidatus Nanopelagicales bacterium]
MTTNTPAHHDTWWTPAEQEPSAPSDRTPGAWIAPQPEASSEASSAALGPQAPFRHSPPWARWALAGLLAATAVLYLWGLSANGWANSYYSAAAQAGGSDWKAWFFGSLDSANSITVDKTPASLWLTGLSVRLFGLSSWSILVPQALLGVASVGVLYATVRRWFGPWAGLIAGAVLALTPVATLMFRFNNPDAMLVLLLVCAAWAMGRATERASMRWIMLAGAFVGFAFLAKMMQAFLVLPGFVAMYAVAAPTDLRRRIGHLAAAFGAMILAAGWWVAVVELWPTDARPYIGGSQDNSVLELMLGYNGFGRLTGNETGSVVGGGQRGAMWGETGWDRLFTASYGGQVAWLLPAAVVMIAILLWVSRRTPRSDLTRAAAIGWGGWLLVTAAVISFSQGIIHQYYTVALAPAIAALVGIGSIMLWQRRTHRWARGTAAVLIVGSAWWAAVLLGRSPDFVGWLAPVVLVGGLAAGMAYLLAPMLPSGLGVRIARAAGIAGLVVALAGPAAYSLETATSAASGSLPSAGPAVAGAGTGPGARGPGGQGGPGQPTANGSQGGAGTTPTAPGVPGGQAGAGQNVPGLPTGPGAGGPGAGGPGTGGPATGGATGSPGAGRSGAGGGPNSLLEASTPSPELTAALVADADQFTWVAAAVGANTAAGYQLASAEPVMAIGGFNGSDPAPTLAQFQALVAAGQIHWFLDGGDGFGTQMGGSDSAAQISAWVQSNFAATTIDATTLYDLSAQPPTTAPSAPVAL